MVRLLKFCILIIIGIFSVVFSVINRTSVIISFNPFINERTNPEQHIFTYSIPLYLIIFATLIMGIVLGGFAAWLAQSKWRRRARKNEQLATQQKHRAQEAETKVKELLPESNHDIPLLS